MAQIQLRTDSCDLDFLSLGALVHRLDPGVIPFERPEHLKFTYRVANTMWQPISPIVSAFALVSLRRW